MSDMGTGVFIIRSLEQYYFQGLTHWQQPCKRKSGQLMSQSQVNAIRRVAAAGEYAGFSLEQMIQLLGSGMSVVALLDLIIGVLI